MNKFNTTKRALVLAGSRGIGKSISDSLSEIGVHVDALSSKQLDTSNIKQCIEVSKNYENVDILVLNTGGPPAKKFNDISEDDWCKYHNQLFLGFASILQNLKINDGGFIFLVSSYNIKEPDPNLILSNTYRLAFTSLLKSLSPIYAEREVSCINIAPGPMDTDRFNQLNNDPDAVGRSFPMKRVGQPREIGDFVSSIVDKEIKYLTGVTINFDGAISKGVL
jgi:3-oxoacyl-[acyl-carrier protein] reductase